VDYPLQAFKEALPSPGQRIPLGALIDLTGRTAIISGGAGPGLGRACADRFAGAGANLFLVDIDSEVARVAKEVAERHGVAAASYVADASDADQVSLAVGQCLEQLGSVDVLVNSVGGGGVGKFMEQSSNDVLRIVDRNFVSALLFIRAVADVMITQSSGGSIVSVASQAAHLSWTGTAVYGACKAGIVSLTANLAQELSMFGIRINAVSPGTISSTRLVNILEHAEEFPQYAESLAMSMSRTALRRPCSPDEIADVIVFLASDAASYVQGSNWDVSGGMG
jgi:NAD(P)-dependent dehydrogenase (short-subunit alcohol dehydrogenase family)